MKLSFFARCFAGFLLIAVAIGVSTLTMRVIRPDKQKPALGQSLVQFATLRPTKFLQNLEDVQQLKFCEDGTRLFTKSRTGRISVYEVGSWRRIRQWKTDFGMLYVSSDGKRLLVRGVTRDFSSTASNYTTYKMWDVDSGKLLSTWQSVFSRQAKRSFSLAAVSPDLTRAILHEYEHVPDKPNRPSLQARAMWVVDAATGRKLQRLPANLNDASLLRTEWQDQTLQVYGDRTPLQFFRTSDWKPIRSLPKTTKIAYSPNKKIMTWPVNGRNYAQFVEDKGPNKQFGSLALFNIQTQTKQQIPTDFDFILSVVPTAESLVIHAARKHKEQKKRKNGEETRYQNVVQFRTLDGQQIKTERPGYIKKMSSNRKVLMIATRYESTPAEKAATYEIFRASDGQLLCYLDRKANPLGGDWEETHLYDQEYMELSPDGKWCVLSNMNGLMRIWELPSVD